MEMRKNLEVEKYLNKWYIYTHAVPRLVGLKDNKEMLADAVYKPFLNLAITFWFSIDDIIVKISKEVFEKTDLDMDILYNCALENIKGQERITSIMDTIIGFMEDAELESVPLNDLSDKEIYVLSSQYVKFGSSYLLDEDLLKKIFEKIGDFVIIGSSQYELLFIADNKGIDYKDLLEMNKQVNATEVSAEDVLADAIYLYSGNGLSQVA